MSRSVTLRTWQLQALEAFRTRSGDDFLAVACPGAGKTTFALSAARQWLAGEALPVVVVVPTQHLKQQWCDAATRFGMHLDPDWDANEGRVPADMHGVIVTYAQAASAAAPLRQLVNEGIAVIDEVHHAAAERSWGDGVLHAFETAGCRLLLSGTPFRSDDNPIPFVRYTLGDHGEALADYEYGYGEALADGGVVRPVFFPRYDGHMEWVGADGALREASFSDDVDREQLAPRLRTALDPDGDWLHTVIGHADDRLRQVRETHPDAAGLVIAIDQEHARAIARILRTRRGVEASIALSDDPDASGVISRFAAGDDPWIVAVRMISEGVDIPRLRVAVFATTTTTALFFRQVVGRIARWTPGLRSQRAYCFVPDDPRLRHHAATVAQQRRHSIDARRTAREEAVGLDDLAAPVRAEEQMSLFTALSSSTLGETAEPSDGVDPTEDLVCEVEDLIGHPVELPPPPPLPGRSPDALASLTSLRSRHDDKRDLRDRNTTRVRDLALATGKSHMEINSELNRLAGIDRIREATAAQLEARLRSADRWLDQLSG